MAYFLNMNNAHIIDLMRNALQQKQQSLCKKDECVSLCL